MGCDQSETEKIKKEIGDFKLEVIKMRESNEWVEQAIVKSSKKVLKGMKAQKSEPNELIQTKPEPAETTKGQLVQ